MKLIVDVATEAGEVETAVKATYPPRDGLLMERVPARAVAPSGMPKAPASWKDRGVSEVRGVAPPVPVEVSSTRTGAMA